MLAILLGSSFPIQRNFRVGGGVEGMLSESGFTGLSDGQDYRYLVTASFMRNVHTESYFHGGFTEVCIVVGGPWVFESRYAVSP